MKELWYYLFQVHFYDEYADFEKRIERGVMCAESKVKVMEKLEQWYGENNIYNIRIYDVDMDTNEILFEKNFPGLIDLLEWPVTEDLKD